MRASSLRHLIRGEARVRFFEYTETFYNRRRRYWSLDYQAPEAYEQLLACMNVARIIVHKIGGRSASQPHCDIIGECIPNVNGLPTVVLDG